MPRLIMLACLLGAVALLAPPVAADEAEDAKPPWPSDVEGFVPPKPGEHPRLLFRESDLERIRARARTPEGRAIVERLKQCLGSDGLMMTEKKNDMTSAYGKGGGPKPRKQDWPVGTYSISHVAGFGMMYQLTGNKRWAELGKTAMEWAFKGVRDRDREARYSWLNPGGALRAGPSLGWYALGYDLCYDGWDEDFRLKVARAIQNYDQGKNKSLPELVRGSRHMPGSNHWGMQVGGGAMAVLAIMNDPGVDMAKVSGLLKKSQKAMIRNMTEGFGNGGWFAEGDGTGSMSSQIIFIPALQAWKTAGGKDFITPRMNAPWMTLKWIFLTVPRNGKMDFPSRGAYPHNVWDRDGISGAGYFNEGFAGVRPAHRPGLLWFYNHHLAKRDAENGTPFDTVSPYPHHSILALVNWPWELEEANPATCIPRAYGDTIFDFYAFRNRWKDENDIVISVQTKYTRGWHKANKPGPVMVWALGKKQTFGRLRVGNKSDVKHWQPAADGSGILQGDDGTCLAVDFSGASGADAMLAMIGPGAPGGTTVKLDETSVSLLFLDEGGASPEAKVEGDKIVVGEQTISLEDGRLVLGKMAGPFEAGETGSAAASGTKKSLPW